VCQREDIHGDGDLYEFPDGAGISPEEGVAVLDRSILYLRPDKVVPLKNQSRNLNDKEMRR